MLTKILLAFFLATHIRNLIRVYHDNKIKQRMIIKSNTYQIKLITNLLTNNHINIKILNNKIIILNNHFNINITKLLNKHYINYSLI